MATTRINGVRINLPLLTEHELDALLNRTADRIADAKFDLERLQQEKERRAQRMLNLGL